MSYCDFHFRPKMLSLSQSLGITVLLTLSLGTAKTEPVLAQNQTSTPSPEMTSFVIPGGWITLKGHGVELSLPQNYKGGNPRTDLDRISEQLKKIVPDYQQRIDFIKNSAVPFVLVAFDSRFDRSGFLNNVSIVSDNLNHAPSLEQYLESMKQKLGSQYKIVAENNITVNQIPSKQLIADLILPGLTIRQVFYIIPTNKTYWTIVYSTSNEEFAQKIPMIETSIQTLKFNFN
jgi:hypothetical protein